MRVIADARPPIRILTRGLAELQTDVLARAVRVFGSIDRFAIFSLLVGQSLRVAANAERPISILAIASSLSQPFETVRRNVRKLRDADLCQATPAGIVIGPSVLARPEIAELARHTHDCLVRFIEMLIALEAIVPPRPAAVPYSPLAGLRAASDLMLAIAESNRDTHASFDDLVIFSAVLAFNYRDVTLAPDLAIRIRNETHVVPRTLLRPVRPSVIARTMGLPETTVRRRMHAMLDSALTRVAGGYLISKPWLNDDHAIAVSRNSYVRVKRVIGDLAIAGFPFQDTALAYQGDGAPPLTTFL